MSRSRKRQRGKEQPPPLPPPPQKQKQQLPPNHSKRPNESKLSDDSPVVIQYIDYGTQNKESVPSISLHPDLDTLLYPLKAKTFLKDHLRQKAVHVTCHEEWNDVHATTRVAEICQEMCHLNVESILRETSSDNVFVWLRRPPEPKQSTSGSNNNNRVHNNNGNNKNKTNQEKDLIQSIEVTDVETAIALYKIGGHATYCRAPPKVEQSLVSSLLRATGLGCGQYDPSGESIISMGRGEVETFVSTPDHVTNWHCDFQENFTIQLSGRKRWTIQQGTIRDPLRGCTPHYAAPEAVESQLKAAHLFDRKFQFGHPITGTTATGDIVSIDVKPGDVFYFPAGMWHKVETIEPGVSINVSLMATSYAQMVGQAIQHYLFQLPNWRQPVRNNSAHDVVEHLKQLLFHLPTSLQGLSHVEWILPPILQHPPTFYSTEDDEDHDDNDDEAEDELGQEIDHGTRKRRRATKQDGDSDDDDGNEDEGSMDSIDDEGGNKSMSNNDEDEGVLTEEVIDPREYHDKNLASWHVANLVVDTPLVFRRNPLAVLHSMDEMTRFYGSPAQEEEEEGSGGMMATTTMMDNVFVLNVNYAGNEMHQSAVRVVFCDSESGLVQRLHDKWECNTVDLLESLTVPSREIRLSISRDEMPLIKFLIYHGYLTVDK